MQSLGMSITKAEREQREAAGHSRPVVTSKAAERHRLRQDVYIYIWTLNGGEIPAWGVVDQQQVSRADASAFL